MRIIEIIPNLQSGGAEKFVVDLTNELSHKKHDCTLITLFTPTSEETSNDILSAHLDKNVKRHSLGKRMGFDPKCLVKLYQYIKKEKPEVVHAHIGAITYLVFAVLFYRKCKYFATIHSDARYEAGGSFNKYIRRFLFKMGLVQPITISKESEKSFQEFYGKSGIIITNGCSQYTPISLEQQCELEKDVDFLFIHVGSIQHVKNQETLVKAFSHMLCDGVRARLLLIGRRFDEKIYQKLEPYFSSEIIYLGEQENPRSFMSFCDAFCMSSLWEGMPISIIEAFSVGCPPIVTPVGGCLNMIKDGENGLLAEDASEEAYYRALKRFITLAKNERIEMSRNALKSYQECYSIEKTAEEYLLLFRGDK